jgi:hypothetical protein
MRRLDDNNRAKCEEKRGGSILRSVSVIPTYFFTAWIGELKI